MPDENTPTLAQAEQAIEEARITLEAMKKSQPGPHINVLEQGFAVLYNFWVDETIHMGAKHRA